MEKGRPLDGLFFFWIGNGANPFMILPFACKELIGKCRSMVPQCNDGPA
jgi:hypothetical protein